MYCSEDDSPPYVNSYQNGRYSSSSIASASASASASSSSSSSSASVWWSDASSQSSDDSSVTGASSDNEISETYCWTSQLAPSLTTTSEQPPVAYWPNKLHVVEAAPEPRHPRRTSGGAGTRSGCPPSLVRQCDRKINFVDGLVDSSAQIVEAIWPLSSVVCRGEVGSKGVLPLRTFIQETLRRSRTSYSTLQVALYYLILIKPHVPKHDFTMEQPDDAHSVRALQCGRRMFLSALILASKYLQDRNYSARAWSKISGLNTLEINQNEMAFLLAVKWELHITDSVFRRWTEIVLGNSPTQPPSPGSAPSRLAEQDWKSVILRLTPELDNIEGLTPRTSPQVYQKRIGVTSSPRSFAPLIADRSTFGYGSNESTPTQKCYAPSVLEPSPSTVYPASKPAPALGLLPTPRLTPQSTGFNTPAVSAASYMLGKSSMGYAMAQASNIGVARVADRWQPHVSSSSPRPSTLRRSSLANSVSSMSSPESMVSDSSSRSSRSSSISSASFMMCAPTSSKLDVQARCRYAKLCSEKQNRSGIATVPEYCDNGPTSSPESYTGPVSKEFLDLSLGTPLARQADLEVYSKDQAARALQELHNHPRSSASPIRAGEKRSRPQSIDNSLQENVREMLSGRYQPSQSNSSDRHARTRSIHVAAASPQVAVRSTYPPSLGRKRICCATEAANGLQRHPGHPVFGGLGGPGMWQHILN
ncbi:uncharacterized protein L3040_000135 [Drepanopeziza brunnea f. sp. 'multigermtubi']|uniref:Cyclin n=1 Tax=Marssonina brunnea f. sp. multigermtubi (strain MB_m1) TaxID=1072389 RepID=K1WQI1_MARBU|nr:cyclin [Drepanopeziza brunnea f. sp. 'multigermtubi' MB_m1]EKD14612.1 cyclin [Drepanopeziza brunnea f. sp. 'multigermtubi' MB_m1]KAJ5053844.1 hypothetical protein L3040_000135 [Drepanopeziza brunnea f. sp. 'multigermtubi']